MTSQMLMTKVPVNSSQTSEATGFVSSDQPADARQSRLLEAMKAQYGFDQQVKFLDLQAETESLLKQLQALKQQRAIAPEPAQTVNV